MRLKRVKKLLGLACVAAVAVTMVGACSQNAEDEPTSQELNRAYMSQVQQISDDLQEGLDAFADAVSRDDLVAMQTQLENACKNLDALDELDVPEDLEDVHAAYAEGAEELRTALKDYVDLYSRVDSAEGLESFDWSSYGDLLKDIQEKYDAGIESLSKGDTLASEKE